MRVDDFDFELPNENIALRPLAKREAAKLLRVSSSASPLLSDHHIYDLVKLLHPGDALVFNDTRVVPARLSGRRIGRGETNPKIEITLHQRNSESCWLAFAKPGRKLRVDDVLQLGGESAVCYSDSLNATISAKGEGGEIALDFELSGTFLDEAIAQHGVMPLPPYIASQRAPDAQDERDYQTIYATREGAVAAPTAGLHFTGDLMQSLKANDISCHFLTLHVGAGTFLPVKVDDTADHKMHREWGEITESTAKALNQVKAQGNRLICVGTTSLRMIETAAQADGTILPMTCNTDIFITPGYKFKVVDGLFTNFHTPRSTLFMLVSAFCGLDQMRQAYAHAIKNTYRFYSYGDACLLERKRS
jgi:S-adenosylmethionine:tRNA ribosyltransferase-isomerase